MTLNSQVNVRTSLHTFSLKSIYKFYDSVCLPANNKHYSFSLFGALFNEDTAIYFHFPVTSNGENYIPFIHEKSEREMPLINTQQPCKHIIFYSGLDFILFCQFAV